MVGKGVVFPLGANPYTQYQKTQVETADQGKLLFMLYEGALRFLGRARKSLQEGNGEEANNNLVRAQEIIAELMASLDLEAGDVAVSLFRLYEYMHYQLVQANIKKEITLLDQVETMLLELKETWYSALGGGNGSHKGQAEETAAELTPALQEDLVRQEEKSGIFAGYGPGLREQEALKKGYKRVNLSG